MTIDASAAGLLAEVIPALLVFLALEDRLSPSNIPRRKWRRRLTRWREAAVVANLVAAGRQGGGPTPASAAGCCPFHVRFSFRARMRYVTHQ